MAIVHQSHFYIDMDLYGCIEEADVVTWRTLICSTVEIEFNDALDAGYVAACLSLQGGDEAMGMVTFSPQLLLVRCPRPATDRLLMSLGIR